MAVNDICGTRMIADQAEKRRPERVCQTPPATAFLPPSSLTGRLLIDLVAREKCDD